MAQRILGLDIGARTVKAVVVASTYRGYTVLETRQVPVPPAEGAEPAPLRDRQLAAVTTLVEGGLAFEQALVALPGTSAAHHVTLPFTDPRRLEQTVGFEVESQIPFDLSEVAWDWQPLEAREGKSELFVAVVKKDELAALLSGLAGAGVDPRVVIPPGPAYAALLEAGVLDAPPAPVAAEPGAPEVPAAADLILDLGATRTSVCVVVQGACEAARTFPLGAHELVSHMAARMGGDPDAAQELLLSSVPGTAPAPAPEGAAAEPGAEPLQADALGGELAVAEVATLPARPDEAVLAHGREAFVSALAPLLRELRSTLRAWRARAGVAPRPVGRLWLAGELARVPWLAEALQGEVEGPVAPVALAGPAGEAIAAADAPGLALALSLALRGHQGSRAPRLNLRRGDLSYTRDFQHLRGKVARLGAWAALVLLLALVSSGVKVFALSRQEDLLDKALCDATQKLVGRCYEDFDTAVSVLKGKGTPAAAIPKNSAVDVFTELATRTPQELTLKYDRIEITRDKLHLQGLTDTAESVDRIVSALRGSRCFGDARSGGARRRSTDGKFEFTIDSDLTCDTGATPGGKG
jgi:general secretion pathway protein L